MKSISIVIINDYAYVNGGAGEVAISSAIELSKRGHNVFLVSAVGPIDERLISNGVEVVCFNQEEIVKDGNRLRASVQGLWNKKAHDEMRNLLENLNSESTIIHFHGWTKALSSAIAKPVIEKGFPSVVSLHEYFTACPNGAFYNYQTESICKLKPMSKECILCNCDKQSYKHKLYRVLRQKIQKSISGIPIQINNFIKISEFSFEILQPYLPTDSNFYKVNNPINIPEKERVNPAQNRFYTQVGRLDIQKGPHLFLDAGKMADIPVKFIGDGPERESIENNRDKVLITGWLERKNLIEELKKSRALIFPSLWYETQGLVVLEAAALGIPSIVSDECAARDFVTNNETGLWFKSGDTNDLKKKIEIFKDDNILKKMGDMAYQKYWESPCTMDRHINELERVYKKIIFN